MIRRSLRSTLFPYTTLFRSDRRNGRDVSEVRCDDDGGARIGGPGAPFARDRKSTRLNSSHRCISYAVFCLKKKRQVPGQRVQIERVPTEHVTIETPSVQVTR